MKPKRSSITAAGELAGGYIKALKARRQEVGVWEVRGRVFARVMVAARDSRLSGAEWAVLSTLALHLQHLGRSKGMMSMASLADDCMVTERTVRNALRTLGAAKFVSVKYRASGQMTVMLDRRFGPKAPVPVDKSAGIGPRRSAPRKKISTTGTPRRRRVVPSTDECENSAPRRESNGAALRAETAYGLPLLMIPRSGSVKYDIPLLTTCRADKRALPALAKMGKLLAKSITIDKPPDG